MSETSTLIAALRGHYIQPGKALPGAAFLAELTDEDTGRRVDALALGFWASSGRQITGHEVKVSRGDWLRELAEPAKADVWMRRCHRWYVVTPSTAIVKPEELPEGWGLMLPPARGRRFRVVVEAADRDPRVDLALLQVVAKRLDADRARAEEERDRARVDAERERSSADHHRAQAEAAGAHESARRLKQLDELEAALGRKLSTYGYGHGSGIPTIGVDGAVAALRAWSDAAVAGAALQRELQRPYELANALRTLASIADTADRARDALAALQPAGEQPPEASRAV